MDAPDEGEVRFGGRPIDADMRARFGYVPEERGLSPKTPALRQLTYLGRLHRLDKAGVEDIDTAADALRALGVEPVDVQRIDGGDRVL